MRNFMLGFVLVLVALGSFVSPVRAAPTSSSAAGYHGGEGRGTFFIVPAKYKKNISLAEFRKDIRGSFRSEAAFDLIVDFTGDTIGKPDLSRSEFISLMNDDSLTRVRNCVPGEQIKTGAMERLLNIWGFHWFTRLCRPGEQIVQVLVNGVWTDLFSLNCLNAVEDPTPAPFVAVMPVRQPQIVSTVYAQRPQTHVVATPGMVIGGTVVTVGCVCCGQGSVFGTPTVYLPGQVSVTTTFGF